MQTSARRPNIEARGRGVVRWLPWVAYLLQELGWIKTATHETRLPGLPDGIPVQVRQNVADHRWYVVSNAGVWGLTGFRTAERAEGYAQHIVIDPDGQEYRRARRNPVEDMPPSQRHGRDEPDPRPPSELYLAVVAAARLEYGPGTAARIASMVTEYNVRIDAIDRAYAAGDEAAVEANAGRAEELRIELVGLYHELEFGQEDYTDAEANAEEELAVEYLNYLQGTHGLKTPEDLIGRLRGVLEHYAGIAKVSPAALNAEVSDEDLLNMAREAGDRRAARVGQARQLQRTRRKSPVREAERFAKKAKRQKKKRGNPIPEYETGKTGSFVPGELTYEVDEFTLPPAPDDDDEHKLQIRLWADTASVERVAGPQRLADFLLSNDPDSPWLFRYTGNKRLVRVGSLDLVTLASVPNLWQVANSDVPRQFRELGLGAYLYSIGADEAAKRGGKLTSIESARSDHASDTWASRRLRRHYDIGNEWHPLQNRDREVPEFQTAVPKGLQTSAPTTKRQGNPKRQWRGGFESPEDPSYFYFMAGQWDVRKALELIRAREGYVDQTTIDPKAWINMLGGMIYLDPQRVDAIDLDKSPPIVVAQLPDSAHAHADWPKAFKDDRVTHMVIDGWHRMKKATDLGVQSLPAILLTPEESYEVRVDSAKDGPEYGSDDEGQEAYDDFVEETLSDKAGSDDEPEWWGSRRGLDGGNGGGNGDPSARRFNPEEALGNCYQLAAELVLDQSRWGEAVKGPLLTLVHGRPTLQRPPFHKFGHAWTEYDDEDGVRMVRDPTSDVEVPAILYYGWGNIDAAENYRYDATEARVQMLKTKHWGPWEGPESVGPTSKQRKRNPDEWEITAHDKELAQWGLGQLERERLEVVLIPSDYGRHKVRVAVGENPEFYRRFLDRRRSTKTDRKKPRTPGYRKRVTAALERVVAGSPVRRGKWIGWELLDILRQVEEEEFGGQTPPPTPLPEDAPF